MREYEALVNALKQRNIFSDVVMKKSTNPQGESVEGYDFIMYLFNPDPTVAGWYIRGHNWTASQKIRMEGDDRLARTMSSLDSIEELARSGN
jgi:hypothetical protein